MVWGCSSGAGKSLVTTAICRWAANQGLRVAPFKAQNMSNNARVVPGRDGAWGEIGSAQYFQALAARVGPTVDMNPVLLKPERDTGSQVIVQGRVDAELGRSGWRERSGRLAAAARDSFDRLAAQHELLVIEGAGSPAEINLAAQDYVNLGVARWARERGDTQALLVSDIDRGGAFAHLYGTWQLLPEDLRPLLGGFLLNKFRGDAALLEPAPADLQRLTGVPVVGVLPMLRDHGLPEEDGLQQQPPQRAAARLRIAILAAPSISNLDEFQPLQQLEAVQLVWARDAQALAGADWIVLPGSKQVSGDLDWLRRRGIDAVLRQHVAAARPLLAICGGLQLIGQLLDDPDGVDGGASRGAQPGLGLLPLHTVYAAPKRVRPGRLRFAALHGCWQALSGLAFDGYEIRCGRSTTTLAPALRSDDGLAIGWQQGSVLGVYGHGLFESPAVMQALFGVASSDLDARLDALAAQFEAAMAPGWRRRLLGG